jgi:hypothetical protein
MNSPLNFEQVHHFLEHGYVVVSGLIPRDIADAADAAVFRHFGARRDDPSTWKLLQRELFTNAPELMAVFTPEVCRAVGQLASTDPCLFPVAHPFHGYVLTIPRSGDGPQLGVAPHMDGAGYNSPYPVPSQPQPWKLFTMIYLHDGTPGGGNTMVWPDSARKYEALWRSNPQKYRFMKPMIDDRHLIDLGDPIELVPKAGDVAFIDQRCWHSGSLNNGPRPRVAMNHKW